MARNSESSWDEYARTSNAAYTAAAPAASAQVVPENDGRVSLLIMCIGAFPVWLQWRGAASINGGIKLTPPGVAGTNYIQLSLTADGRTVRGPVQAIGDGGASAVAVLESIHPCACMREGIGVNPTY